jgi:hypothetical protein
MAPRELTIWYDAEGDYLEVLLSDAEGFFEDTDCDRVMKRVDADGNLLGFSVLGLSALKDSLMRVRLTDG